MLFSPREAEHIRSLRAPEIGFCASFGCKEAFFKAVRRPFRWTECEFFPDPDREEGPVHLSDALRREIGGSASARVLPGPAGEWICLVYWWAEEAPP